MDEYRSEQSNTPLHSGQRAMIASQRLFALSSSAYWSTVLWRGRNGLSQALGRSPKGCTRCQSRHLGGSRPAEWHQVTRVKSELHFCLPQKCGQEKLWSYFSQTFDWECLLKLLYFFLMIQYVHVWYFVWHVDVGCNSVINILFVLLTSYKL